MLVNYEYYQNIFKGNIVPQEEFERIEIRASSQINMFIMGRDYMNYKGKDYSKQVKMATCSAIDILYDVEQKKKNLDSRTSENGSKVITSEKVKDYSRNYETISYAELQKQISDNNVKKLILKEIEPYLWATGLLNRGVDYV